MNIYRIEHKEKKLGPYQGWAELSSRYWMPEIAPDPRQDGLGQMHWKERSGFVSIRQMVQWFRIRDIFRMRREGFRVYKFKVSKRVVRVGGKQVCFARHTAFQKQEVRMTSLAWHRARSVFGT